MDSSWQAVQNWLLFGGVAGGLTYYYWPRNKPAQSAATTNRRRSIQEQEPKPKRRVSPERSKTKSKAAEKTGTKPAAGNDGAKKRKGQSNQQAQPAPTTAVQEDEPEDEVDLSTRQFAEQMSKARKGNDLSTSKSRDQKVRTVRQGNAANAPAVSSISSQADVDADDDLSPAESPAMHAGDVSDMLEPAGKGPSTLRLTASAKPQKEKVARQPKQEETETKKQRQNRMKKEQQRLERETEEKDRKGLEERQRRAAREARGEPAKNGIPVSKPPTSNAWTAPKPSQSGSENAAPAVNGASSAPLLDTFDAESSASSNGGMEASTAATSTTGVNDGLSEEEQMAKAMKQSEDESGWTTVAMPKKQQKKKTADDATTGDSTPVEPTPKPKAAPAVKKTVTNGKPNGFQALNDQYEQRADVDPNDASNWDA